MYFSVTPKLDEDRKGEFNNLLNDLVNQFDARLRTIDLRMSLLATHPNGTMEKIADSRTAKTPDDYACHFIWIKGQERGVAGLSAARKNTVFIPDLQDNHDPNTKYYVVLPHPHTVAGTIICVPLLDTSRKPDELWHCIGVLNVSFTYRNAFTKRHVRLVEEFVNHDLVARVRTAVLHLWDDTIDPMHAAPETLPPDTDEPGWGELGILSEAVFRIFRDVKSIDPDEIKRDIARIVAKNDHGRHSPHHHQRAKIIERLFNGRESEAVSLEEIGLILGDLEDNKAASQLISRTNADLEALGSQYEIARTSAYYFRRKR